MKYYIFRDRKVLTGWGFEDEEKTSSGRWLAFGSIELARNYLDEAGLPTDVTIQPFDQQNP